MADPASELATWRWLQTEGIIPSYESGDLRMTDGSMHDMGCSRLAGLPKVIGRLLSDPGVGTASILNAEPTLNP